MINAVPKRWRLGLLMSCGVLINYIDRVNISHALLPMSEDLDLNPVQQGLVLSSFSWGYIVFMFVGGMLVDRLGALKMAGTAAGVWSIATALSGAAWDFQSLMASRFAVGAGEAPIFPANASLVKNEFPLEERGRATALFDAGSYLGTAVSAPIVVYVMLMFGWRASFFYCALLGIIWVGAWRRLSPMFSTDSHRITRQPTSFRDVGRLIRSRKVLGASYGFFAYNYAKSFFLTWFPAYLVTERGFSFIEVGVLGMIPSICAVFGEFAAGVWTDQLILRGKSVTVARKLPLCLGMVLASSIGFTELVTSPWAVLALLSFAFAATIAASPGIWALPGDIAPSSSHVGIIGGIQNTFSNIAGVVAPIVTGALVARTGSFASALIISGVIVVSGAASYWFVLGELSPVWITKEGQ